MTVKERLQKFLKEEGITASEFARKMELSPAYLASMRKSMPEEKVEKLTRLFPQLSRDWLLYGEGEMYREEIRDKGVNPRKLHLHMVPLVPIMAKAGSFDEYVNGVLREECEMIYSPVNGAELAIKVLGDSMEPRIADGSTLFLQKIEQKAFIPWGSPMVVDSERGSLVKMLYPSEDGDDTIIAKSYNPAYPPFEISTEGLNGIYRILCMVTEGISF